MNQVQQVDLTEYHQLSAEQRMRQRKAILAVPCIAQARKQLASVYRSIRKTNPAAARSLVHRVRQAYDIMSKSGNCWVQ